MLNNDVLEHSGIRDTSQQDTPVNKPGRSRSKTLVFLCLISMFALSLVFILPALQRWWSADTSVARETLRIAPVVVGTFTRDVAVQGSVVAAISPTLFAPIEGTVTFLVQAGDRVDRDDEIARIDSPELSNRLAQEQATLDSMETNLSRQRIENKKLILTNTQDAKLAKLNLQASERELTRATTSWTDRLISEQDLKAAQDRYEVAKINTDYTSRLALLSNESLAFELQAQEQERNRQRHVVSDLQRRYESLTLTSPVSGMVGDLAVDQHAMVNTNAALLTVVDLSAFEIDVRIPESYSDDIHIGMEAYISNAGKEYLSLVTAISPQVNQGSVPARLRFAEQTPEGLRQNQRLSGRIILEHKAKALTVNRGGFLLSDGGRFAYRVDGDKAIRIPILTGSGSVSQIEILEGLQANDHIIISNTSQFNQAETILLNN